MSPNRQLSYSSARHPTKIQEVFVGMAFHFHPAKGDSKGRDFADESKGKEGDMEYTMVLHDGTGVMESETFHRDFESHKGEEARAKAAADFAEEVLVRLIDVQEKQKMDVSRVSILVRKTG
jgi:hypothetical protein